MESFTFTQNGPAGRKTNLLFLGGSNTALNDGYVQPTLQALGEHFDVGRVDVRAAVGGNAGTGLWTAAGLPPTPVYDLVFIEYCIDDYGSARTPEKFAHWRWTFESLLAQLRRHNPETRIHVLLFGRPEKRSDEFQQALFAATIEIAQRFRAYCLAVDDYLHGLLADGQADAQLYADDTHYATPVVTSLIGHFVARAAIGTDRRIRAAMRQAIADGQPRSLVHSDHRLFLPLGEPHSFRNGQHSIDTIALPADGPWQKIDVPGSLLQLNYVATHHSARILVAEEGEQTIGFDTRHKQTAPGEFDFLLRNLPFSWKSPPDVKGRPRTMSLRAVSSKEQDGFNYIKQFRMLPPKKSLDGVRAVYLSGALFC